MMWSSKITISVQTIPMQINPMVNMYHFEDLNIYVPSLYDSFK